MREGWTTISLGEVATQYVAPFDVERDQEYISLGVKWYAEGVFARPPKFGREIKGTRLFTVKPGQFIYNRMFATEGSFALVGQEHSNGVVSNEFPAFDLDAKKLTPAYLNLHFQQKSVWDYVAQECVGTTKSRSRWKEARFLEYRLALPPVSEQLRIVDLIGTLDEAIEAAEENALQSQRTFREVREALLAPFVPIEAGSLIFDIKAGRSPSAENVSPSLGEFGVRKVSAVGEFGFKPEEAKTVSDVSIFSEEMRVRANDILISRANTADRVGMVCLVEEDHDNLYLCDKTLRIVPRAGVDPFCLVAVFQSDGARAQLSASGTGTSASMKNISQVDIRGLSLRWPSTEMAQIQFADVIGSHRVTANAARDRTLSLRTLRTNLLTVLLSGDHEIPVSYDALLEVAV